LLCWSSPAANCGRRWGEKDAPLRCGLGTAYLRSDDLDPGAGIIEELMDAGIMRLTGVDAVAGFIDVAQEDAGLGARA
jgi:hypothetical protein